MTGEEYAKMKRREQWRAYYWRNREKRKAYSRDYYHKNADDIRSKHAAYMRERRLREKKEDEES